MKRGAGSTAAIRSTVSRCRPRSTPGLATTWRRTIGPRRRSASSRARSCIRRTASDGRREGSLSLALVAAEARAAGREERRAGARAGIATRGEPDAGIGLRRLHASEGEGRAAALAAEEALQRSALQSARSVRGVLGRLDRRRADPAGAPRDAEPGAQRALQRGRKESGG